MVHLWISQTATPVFPTLAVQPAPWQVVTFLIFHPHLEISITCSILSVPHFVLSSIHHLLLEYYKKSVSYKSQVHERLTRPHLR